MYGNEHKTKDSKIFMYEQNKKVILKVKINMGVIKKFRIKSFKNQRPILSLVM